MFLKKLAIRQQKMQSLRNRKQRRRAPLISPAYSLEFLSFSLGNWNPPKAWWTLGIPRHWTF